MTQIDDDLYMTWGWIIRKHRIHWEAWQITNDYPNGTYRHRFDSLEMAEAFINTWNAKELKDAIKRERNNQPDFTM